jgi:hypothetical protein
MTDLRARLAALGVESEAVKYVIDNCIYNRSDVRMDGAVQYIPRGREVEAAIESLLGEVERRDGRRCDPRLQGPRREEGRMSDDMNITDMLQAIQDPGLYAKLSDRIAALEVERDQARKDEAEELHRRVVAEADLAAMTKERDALQDKLDAPPHPLDPFLRAERAEARNRIDAHKIEMLSEQVAAAREAIGKAVEFAVVELLDGTESWPDGVPRDVVGVVRDSILARYQPAEERDPEDGMTDAEAAEKLYDAIMRGRYQPAEEEK